MLKFEWNDEKDDGNIMKHGISFAEAKLLFDTNAVIIDGKTVNDEQRWRLINVFKGHEYVVVFSKRSGKIRIISARRARKDERARYWAERKSRESLH